MRASELRRMLAERGLAAQPRLGQHFLVDDQLVQAIPRDAGVLSGERVLEVGPGPGGLTEHLLRAGARLLAVEIDAGLAAMLRERFGDALRSGQERPAPPGSLTLIQGDVLAPHERLHEEVEGWWSEGSAPRVVANLPYGISGPFLARLPGRRLLGACLLLQREVADKAVAEPGGAAYGALSVRLGLAFRARLGRRVPPTVFWPRPEVRSVFLHLEPRAEGLTPEDDRALRALLRFAFSQRRKRLLPRLRAGQPAVAEALLAAGVGADARPEAIPAAAWLAGARKLECPTLGQDPG